MKKGEQLLSLEEAVCKSSGFLSARQSSSLPSLRERGRAVNPGEGKRREDGSVQVKGKGGACMKQANITP